MDEDDDAIHCRLSKYVEAGPKITSNPIPNTSVDKVYTVLYMLNPKVCTKADHTTRKRKKNPLMKAFSDGSITSS